MERTANDAALARDYRTLKAMMGSFAMIAAVGAAAATMMAASLFGALTAFALSAAAGLTALLELTDCGPHQGSRLAAWGVLVTGWIIFAAMLLHAPLGHLEGLRPLISMLIASSAALQAWHCRVQQGPAGPGVIVVLVFALLGLAATWSSAWTQIGDTPATAISFACAFELFGTGNLWLAERLTSWNTGHAVVAHEPALMQMA